MLENEVEMLEFLKWLLKVIVAINWFIGGVQVGIIIGKYINECKCIKKRSEHVLELGIFILV